MTLENSSVKNEKKNLQRVLILIKKIDVIRLL